MNLLLSQNARPSSEGPGVLKDSENVATSLERGGWRDFGFLPIPKHLRYDPARPFQFTMLLNITFGFGSTFTVMNLYYCQPLLIEFAKSFGVTYQDVSRIPTLIQAG
ncbi:hypothetical protein BD410DRAFT_847302 [Rickenella mellea]|uniref:Uncharacterized protein n=1 Tax=Rickenella mellea TaxID=50990 RepID=A0A4Y7PEA7_9AGAM|nr:hypothetical protein BD410DRAFT_847302 [Rickenella mellea]